MQQVIQKVLELLGSAEAQVAVIAVVVEFVLRLVKSPKPLSILYGVGAACRGVGLVFTKIAELLDKVLPQKVEAPAAAPVADQAPKAE